MWVEPNIWAREFDNYKCFMCGNRQMLKQA